jgi:RNA recognition motif-containing protein
MKIFIGNMPRNIDEALLKRAFEIFGEVESLNIVLDKDTGVSKGFGFVEMPSQTGGQKAIDTMAGKDFMGRAITVEECKPGQRSRGLGPVKKGDERRTGQDRRKK